MEPIEVEFKSQEELEIGMIWTELIQPPISSWH